MNSLLMLGIILVTGVVCGGVARRLHVPAITGQILGGLAIGESGLALFSVDEIEGLRPITHFALGLIAVMVGGHLNVRRLRNAGKRLAFLLVAESTITPLLVFIGVVVAGYEWYAALLLATLTVSGAPATTIALVKEARARGVFVKTLVGAVALNNMASIALFAIAHVAARIALDPTAEHAAIDFVLAPFRAISLSAVLGLLLGAALVLATRRIVRPERLATASIVTILVTCGLALQLGLSPLLAALFVGVATANLSPEKEELGVLALADFEVAILAVFFTLAGMQLHVKHLLPAAGVLFLVFFTRFAGKVLAAGVAMSLAGATSRMRRYLGVALLPQAGVAVGLIVLVQEDPALAGIRDFFLTVGLGVVTLNEIVGPLATKLALERSGEAGKDRPRLIDFIREENIIMDLQARTKDEAIETLVDLLITTHGLTVERDRLLASVRKREADMSTCVGNGLAVPHGELEEGESMVGVMGLSRVGLPFETPDGRPVHCVVLLATPGSQRDRHLEVLASLMRAIGADPNIQWQLYNARSPAHAYELLNREEAEGFNYFLN